MRGCGKHPSPPPGGVAAKVGGGVRGPTPSQSEILNMPEAIFEWVRGGVRGPMDRLFGAIESAFALSTQQTFVLVMFSDPKPDHGALLHDSYGAVLPIDPHGPDIAFLIHFFHAYAV